MTSQETEYLIEQTSDEAPLIPRRELEEPGMDITPMIDITFLLLIFFLVAARLDQETPVELPPARHGTAVAINSSAILTIASGADDDALIYRGDGKAADRQIQGDPVTQENAIVAYIEEQIREGKTSVLIKAEKKVLYRHVARVADAVGRAGSGDLYVAVLEVQ